MTDIFDEFDDLVNRVDRLEKEIIKVRSGNCNPKPLKGTRDMNGKSPRVVVRLDEDVHHFLNQQIKLTGIHGSQLIRQYIRAGMGLK